MGFEDKFRMSVHGVFTNGKGDVLLLKANYGSRGWGLPGGALEPGETVHEALARECREEIGNDVKIGELTGIYYHKAYTSQVVIFRCELATNATINLSEEHTEVCYFSLQDLSEIQRQRVTDCIEFNGRAVSRKY